MSSEKKHNPISACLEGMKTDMASINLPENISSTTPPPKNGVSEYPSVFPVVFIHGQKKSAFLFLFLLISKIQDLFYGHKIPISALKSKSVMVSTSTSCVTYQVAD